MEDFIYPSYAAQANYSNTMKTIVPTQLMADPIITEVRRAKTVLAAKYNFDVVYGVSL
jgi:hypothetical protein